MSLAVIGTARRPNKSDLRARGLTGLPDPSPEVALLRAKLESEQAELRAMVGCYEIGVPESFVRKKIDVIEDNEDVGPSDQEETSGTESEAIAVQVEETASNVEKKEVGSDEDFKKSSMQAATVVDEPCEPRKSVRTLRDRSPIQIHPYVLEREGYRQLVKAGRR